MLAKFSEVESERTASKFRMIIKKTKKEGSFMSRSCIDGYETYTKRERTFGRPIGESLLKSLFTFFLISIQLNS